MRIRDAKINAVVHVYEEKQEVRGYVVDKTKEALFVKWDDINEVLEHRKLDVRSMTLTGRK